MQDADTIKRWKAEWNTEMDTISIDEDLGISSDDLSTSDDLFFTASTPERPQTTPVTDYEDVPIDDDDTDVPIEIPHVEVSLQKILIALSKN